LTGDATQVQWTTSGTGSFFPNATVLTPTYMPSAIDTAIGSLTLTLSAPNTCNNATDDLELTLSPAPYVNAGPDQTYCDQVSAVQPERCDLGHHQRRASGPQRAQA
jgi:hypothetical protein